MLKPFSFIVLLALGIVGFALLTQAGDEKSQNVEVPVSQGSVLSQVPSQQKDIVLGEATYRVVWEHVNTNRLSLIPNFDDKETSKVVFKQNNCTVLINGGLYSKDNKPIGYFVSDGTELSPFKSNALLNGVLSINEMDTPRITRAPPRDPLVSAVQTGPVLVENDQVLAVPETNNKPARRMLALVTSENELIFMAVYVPESTFRGPLISKLPQVVQEFEEISGINIADALALDGGSASAFVTPEFSLSEVSPVGSFFCAR